MELYSIDTQLFRLDGGAMFGVVPKTLWNKVLPADDLNMCELAMRLLLIKEDKRLILIDTGIGTKQDEKFFSRYFLHGNSTLDASLQKNGFTREDITDVFLTHLHFDHVGGAIENKDGKLVPAFKNATYWTNLPHWEWAINPNEREKASFLKENLLPLADSGQLKWLDIKDPQQPDQPWKSGLIPFTENISFQVVGGHTHAMMLPYIKIGARTLVYIADLIPTSAHFPTPYVASFDVFPLMAMAEKDAFLAEAIEQNYILFFEHDAMVECCTVQKNDKGRVIVKDTFKLSEISL